MWQKIKNYYHLAQALISAIYFRFPSKSLIVIGVTGTDGKTTTVHMIHHILKFCSEKSSMISSVQASIGGKEYDTGFHVSTPSPFQIQKYLKKAVDKKDKYFVLEATSHGLDQNRLGFVKIHTAVITNITHEHLDYHKTWEKYAQAKSKLFKNVHFSILNADDTSYDFLRSRAAGKIILYSQKKQTDVSQQKAKIKLLIGGSYNISNALAAYSATRALGIPTENISSALRNFKGVHGRMDEIDVGQDFKVFIDFAHTPNGLKNALTYLRSEVEKTKGKMIAVFGSAGGRDTQKRPKMGEVADTFADVIILTAEDPRNEEIRDICLHIKAGIKNKIEGKNLFIVESRVEAIKLAVSVAQKNDIVGIFGKGHEKSMTFASKDFSWDEFEVTKNALSKIK